MGKTKFPRWKKYILCPRVMECPLCFEDCATLKIKGCKHTFCVGCAKEWFTRNDVATCPMCRGPFKFKGMRSWVDEKNERDTIFEDGVNMILAAKKVFRWTNIVVGDNVVMWGEKISKMEKLKDFQRAYNTFASLEWEWEDEQDFEEFVLSDDLDDFIDLEDRITYFDDPPQRWFTKYPQIV